MQLERIILHVPSYAVNKKGWVPAVAGIIARHLSDLALGHQICVIPDLQFDDAVGTKARDLTQRLRKGATGLLAIATAG